VCVCVCVCVFDTSGLIRVYGMSRPVMRYVTFVTTRVSAGVYGQEVVQMLCKILRMVASQQLCKEIGRGVQTTSCLETPTLSHYFVLCVHDHKKMQSWSSS